MSREIIKLASLHVPFDTRIFQKEAKSLQNNGFDVSIIVPHEKDEVVDGIKIIAVPQPQSGFKRLTKTLFQIFLKAFKQNKKAIIHVHDSELLLYALLLKILGRKVVYDAHEDTPRQMMYQHWIPMLLRRPVSIFYYILEKVCGYCFDAIIIAEPIIGRYFPTKKTILVRNFVKVNEQEITNARSYLDRENIITYIGGITEPRGASVMIKALEHVKTKNTKFYLGGSFHPKSLHKKLSDYPTWDMVNYLGWVNRKKVYEILNESRIGIIIPEPNPRYTTNYPVKLFEYMEAGIPVIASKKGISKDFVDESNCGILVDPLDTQEIGRAIDYLLSNEKEAENMGIKGRELIISKYNWSSEEKKLVDLYNSLG